MAVTKCLYILQTAPWACTIYMCHCSSIKIKTWLLFIVTVPIYYYNIMDSSCVSTWPGCRRFGVCYKLKDVACREPGQAWARQPISPLGAPCVLLSHTTVCLHHIPTIPRLLQLQYMYTCTKCILHGVTVSSIVILRHTNIYSKNTNTDSKHTNSTITQ
jgi:hypothetical protein